MWCGLLKECELQWWSICVARPGTVSVYLPDDTVSVTRSLGLLTKPNYWFDFCCCCWFMLSTRTRDMMWFQTIFSTQQTCELLHCLEELQMSRRLESNKLSDASGNMEVCVCFFFWIYCLNLSLPILWLPMPGFWGVKIWKQAIPLTFVNTATIIANGTEGILSTLVANGTGTVSTIVANGSERVK